MMLFYSANLLNFHAITKFEILNFHAITKFEILNFHAITKFKLGGRREQVG